MREMRALTQKHFENDAKCFFFVRLSSFSRDLVWIESEPNASMRAHNENEGDNEHNDSTIDTDSIYFILLLYLQSAIWTYFVRFVLWFFVLAHWVRASDLRTCESEFCVHHSKKLDEIDWLSSDLSSICVWIEKKIFTRISLGTCSKFFANNLENVHKYVHKFRARRLSHFHIIEIGHFGNRLFSLNFVICFFPTDLSLIFPLVVRCAYTRMPRRVHWFMHCDSDFVSLHLFVQRESQFCCHSDGNGGKKHPMEKFNTNWTHCRQTANNTPIHQSETHKYERWTSRPPHIFGRCTQMPQHHLAFSFALSNQKSYHFTHQMQTNHIFAIDESYRHSFHTVYRLHCVTRKEKRKRLKNIRFPIETGEINGKWKSIDNRCKRVLCSTSRN